MRSLLSLIALGFGLSLTAQTTLEYNFQTQHWVCPPGRRDVHQQGHWVQVKVTNINPNYWSVTQTGTSTVPEKATGLNTNPVSGLTDLITQIPVLISGVQASAESAEMVNETSTEEPLAALEVVNNFDKAATPVTPPPEAIALASNLLILHQSITAQQQKLADLQSKASLLKAKLNYQAKLLNQPEMIPSARLISAPTLQSDLKDIADGFRKVLNDELTLWTDKVSSITNVQHLSSEPAKSAWTSLLASHTAFATAANTAWTAIALESTAEKIAALELLYTTNEILLPQLYMDGESLDIKLEIKPSVTPEKTTYTTYSPSYKIYSNRKFYFGVGESVVLSELMDDKYSLEIDDDGLYNPVQEGRDRFSVTLGTMAYVGMRNKTETVGFGLNAGIGASTLGPLRLRYMAGGHLKFGRTHSAVVGIGVVAGYVDRLSKVYEGPFASSAAPSSVTIPVMDTALSFSVGYLFTF